MCISVLQDVGIAMEVYVDRIPEECNMVDILDMPTNPNYMNDEHIVEITFPCQPPAIRMNINTLSNIH